MAQGEVSFDVVNVRRAGDPLPQPWPPGAARLTLVTAEGAGRLAALAPELGGLRRRRRAEGLLRTARPARSRCPRPSRRWSATPGPSRCSRSASPCCWRLTLGVVAARQRWSTALVWVVATPVALALAWATTDVVMRLLPNLI